MTKRTWEWRGGERYGDTHDVHYREQRGRVTRTGAGDRVTVHFSAKGKRTKPFTYRVRSDSNADVLVLAATDYTGTSPDQEPSLRYLDAYTDALEANGLTWDLYDFDAEGRRVPHDLGVLKHYDAVVWYTGDDLVMRDGDEQPYGVSENQHKLNLAVRDYLNKGGKVLYTGKNAGLAESFALLYGTNGAPDTPCNLETAESGCLALSNDFSQYYLGAFERNRFGGLDDESNPLDVLGVDRPLRNLEWGLAGDDSANNQADGTASFIPTSNILPADEFPQFASWRSAAYDTEGAAPYEPLTGEFQMGSQQADTSYKRLTRTVDLTGADSGSLEFATSYNTETDWDYVFVEAHTVGSNDDWTTLPDANGHTTQDTGDSCPAAWNTLHAQLDYYQTINADGSCSPTGTTGEWHAATGTSDGWEQWSVDLSAWAGEQVEVSITYASDFSVQGLGAFIDDTTVNVDGTPVAETSFESDLGGWTVPGAPEGSGVNANDWIRTGVLFEVAAATTTEDSVFFGFGLEAIDGDAKRERVMGRVMRHLLE